MSRTAKLLLVPALWLTVAIVVFRFRHPDLTETQLFLAIPRALLFR